MPPLKNARHEQFALYVGASGLSATAAYIKAGYSKNGADVSASRLLGNASIKARITELSKRVTESVVKREIANRNDRVTAQNERWNLMRQVITERAAEYVDLKAKGKPVPAGTVTGLLVRTVKALGAGANTKFVTEYEVDTGLLRELRAIEEHSAKELGQWIEKKDEMHRFPALKDATEDELRAILHDLGAAEGPDAGDPAGVGPPISPP